MLFPQIATWHQMACPSFHSNTVFQRVFPDHPVCNGSLLDVLLYPLSLFFFFFFFALSLPGIDYTFLKFLSPQWNHTLNTDHCRVYSGSRCARHRVGAQKIALENWRHLQFILLLPCPTAVLSDIFFFSVQGCPLQMCSPGSFT